MKSNNQLTLLSVDAVIDGITANYYKQEEVSITNVVENIIISNLSYELLKHAEVKFTVDNNGDEHWTYSILVASKNKQDGPNLLENIKAEAREQAINDYSNELKSWGIFFGLNELDMVEAIYTIKNRLKTKNSS